MSRPTKIAAKCLLSLFLLGLVQARIISTHYPSQNTDDSTQTGTHQLENKSKLSFSNMNQQQKSDLEKLIKESLEKIFKNEEVSSNDNNNFDVTNKEVEEVTETKSFGDDMDYSSPHILKVPVPQPYPVHIPVKQPFTVPIFKLVPEEVEKRIPITVEKLVPIYKEKPVKIIVEKHHPVTVYKPYAVPVAVNTHILLGKKQEEKRW